MADPTPALVAFDVDGTLTKRDCVIPFLWRVGRVRSIVRGAAAVARLAPAVVHRDRDTIKAIGTDAAFRGRRAAEVEELGEAYAADVARRWLRPDTTELLLRHLDAGDAVVFVSASFEVYLRPLARRLGVQHVLGARLEVDAHGLLTGRLDGPNCRGPEKVRRLTEWWHSEFGSLAPAFITAYGDSPGDRELLAHADVAHWVGGREVSTC